MSTQRLHEGAEEHSADPVPLSAEPVETALAADTPTFAPVAPSQRLASIDFVRGVALLGILLVNVLAFFGPLAMISSPVLMGDQPTQDQVSYVLILALCFSKFFPIFSALFGYGLMGQIDRAAAAGRSTFGFVARRLGLLMLFGAVHALLLWYGDILFFYALVGFILLLFRRASVRGMVVIAVCLVVLTVLMRITFALLMPILMGSNQPPTPMPQTAPAPLRAMGEASFNPTSPKWIAAETKAYRDGPWADAQIFRTTSWVMNLTSIPFLGVQVVAMFVIGALLWRVRFFDPEQAALRRRLFLIALPTGLALEAVAAVCYWFGLADKWMFALGGVVQAFSTCILPLGYLSGLALLADVLPAWLRSPVAGAGRMALTVYLLETVVATMLSYHWGFRLFGTIGVMTQALLAIAIWLGLVALSWLWLQFFRQGPMERLWRRLEYGRTAA